MARGELVPVRAELKALLYIGVLVAVTGVGIFVKDHHDRLGPVAIASALALGALACFAYAFRRSPAFSWDETASPHLAQEYVLTLGALLLASDLAYVEKQFDLLGDRWPYHFLVVAAVYFLLAYRFDSRAVLSLALAAFAAWRGVSAGIAFQAQRDSSLSEMRWNALACGALFLAAGALTARSRLKPHFENVYVTAGLLLVFGGILSGVLRRSPSSWFLWEVVLALFGSAVLAIAWRLKRPLEFAIALAALWLGVLRLTGEVLDKEPLYLGAAVWSVAAIVVLIRATRRIQAER
ncbi:MAG: DUF2157 domain-containing protein [Acidobacteriota bacterium]|nr:DUF2157 domain-containing protein [Acidobacteriota bacterium]MDQ5872492.1 DUF2157 domain-containing protein [Acidobacteriota bacterium]